MRLLYTVGIYVMHSIIWVSSLFSKKAKMWITGRQSQRSTPAVHRETIWFHCASLGEFEQARPLMERIHTDSNKKVLLTFFSPSGYEQQKNYRAATQVLYSPLDTPARVKNWLDRHQPTLLVLTKYDFWYNMLDACQQRSIPVVLIAGLFRPSQWMFRHIGSFFLKHLRSFDHLFVQNEASSRLLQSHDLNQVSAVGDPRIDRVLQIAHEPKTIEVLEHFCKSTYILIVGSSWSQEEKLVLQWLQKQDSALSYQVILAPHDVSPSHIQEIIKLIDIPYQLSTDYESSSNTSLLIINEIGILSAAYRYASLAFIGGGFKKNIHNILEPMAFDIPILMGPNYQNFPEAVAMAELGGAQIITDERSLADAIKKWESKANYEQAQSTISQYMQAHRGATEQIHRYFQQKEWI